MKLMIQPDDGIEPLLEAIRKAKKAIHILIFRFDRTEVEKELLAAVERGVTVQALIAFTNRGEEKNLRRLEMRLLEKGVTVARTSDDLVRYHGKMLIVDHKRLFVMAYNLTYLDICMSRSFAIMVDNPKVVADAMHLFEADSTRKPYTSGSLDLVVSPINARARLLEFIEGAKKELLIYEMKLSDRVFVDALNKKIAAGVDVRILGKSSAKSVLPTRILGTRLHTRAILRDGNHAFVGSQSMRRLELDARREIGILFHDHKIVMKMKSVFESDWAASSPAIIPNSIGAALDVPAKKVARAVAKKMSIKPMVEEMLDKMHGDSDVPFEPAEISQAVHEAFRAEVHDAVVQAVKELVTASEPEAAAKPPAA